MPVIEKGGKSHSRPWIFYLVFALALELFSAWICLGLVHCGMQKSLRIRKSSS